MKKKNRIFILCICAFLILPMLLGYRAYADTQQFNVEVTCGFNGVAKSNSDIPITVEITNEGADFSGTVTMSGGMLVAYATDIVIGAGEIKNVSFCMSGLVNYNQIKITITDSSGKKVYSKESIVRVETYSTPFVGVLSDDYGALSYLSNLSLRETMHSLSYPTVINLTKSMPSADYSGLDMFDVIVLNDIHTDQLTREQGEALKTWIEQGGTLLIGTGVNYQKTVSGFINDYLGGTVGRIENKVGYMGLWEDYGAEGSDRLSVDVLDIRLTDGAAFNDQWYQLVQRGLGNVAVFQFDLASQNLLGWEYRDRAMESLINDILRNKAGRQDSNIFEYRPVSKIISNIYINDIPNISHYVVVLSAYIILLPLIYLFLKKKDKRHFIWAAVPILSILFGVLIYVTGTGSRLKNPNLNYLCILDMNGYGTRETVYMGSTSPRNKAYSFSVNGEYNIVPMDEYGYYDTYALPGQGEAKITIKRYAYINNVAIRRNSSFETSYFYAQKYEDSVGDIRAQMEYLSDGYHLIIANNTGLEIENAGIIIPNYGVIAIGRLGTGETMEYGESDIIQLRYGQDPAAEIIPYPLVVRDGENIRQNQVSIYNSYAGHGYAPYLIGFASGYIPNIGDNPGIDTAGDTMIVKQIEEMGDGSGIYIPDIRSCLIDYGGTYGLPEYIYESDPLSVTYQFFDFEVKSLHIRAVQNSAMVSFMNIETGDFDRVFLNGDVLSDGLESYLEDGRILKVKYEVDPSRGEYTAAIPIIAALGASEGGQ